MNGPKILTLDIETAPLEVYAWSTWKVNVGLNQIITEWSILSYCAKWLHRKGVIYADCRGQDDVRDDRAMLDGLWALLDEADIVVAQNGVRFDVRKIKARMILLGYEPPSPFKIVDTMLEAKKHFAFTSNRLAWLSEKLTDTAKDEHKKFPGFELWTACLADNPEAWNEMRKYNRRDVVATENLYKRMLPWMIGHPNVANYTDDDEIACPYCGSNEVTANGHVHTQVNKYVRYRCNGCGGWSRGRYSITPKSKRGSLLVN
jgi:predicted RNA-binding Zn-ribbon protein involved in translation (DUF1610 family)